MNKKLWSIVLLCLILLSFLVLILLFVDAGMSIYKINNTETDFSNDTLPGASIIGLTVAALATWGGFLIFGFIISAVGFFLRSSTPKYPQIRLLLQFLPCFYTFFPQ